MHLDKALMVCVLSLQRRHDEHHGVYNHRCLDCLFRCRSKKTPTLRVTGLCKGNSLVTCDFPAQRASNAQNVPFDDATMIYWHMISRDTYVLVVFDISCDITMKMLLFLTVKYVLHYISLLSQVCFVKAKLIIVKHSVVHNHLRATKWV